MGLTSEQIQQLLAGEKKKEPTAKNHQEKRYAHIVQKRGPFRYTEYPMKCVSKRCGVETYIKIDHIPYCTVHALKALNDMVVTLTDRIENRLLGEL